METCSTRAAEDLSLVETVVVPGVDDPAHKDAAGGVEMLQWLPVEFAEGASLVVRLEGRSMEPTLPQGCFVAVRDSGRPEGNELVAFRLNDAVAIRRFTRRRGKELLTPDNPDWPPVPLSAARAIGRPVRWLRLEAI